MEFFDKLGKKASEAYKITADKTGKIAKETKLKIKMSQLRTQITDLYEEIGKKVYEMHIREDDEKEDITEELENLCTKIDVISDEIESLLQQCLELRDRKQCENCYIEMDKECKYCPNCGAKQDDEDNKEESYQNVSLFEEDKKDNLENLEKTVKVESNVEDDNSEKSNEDTETY